ncbi:MAG TPA: TIGR02710 family CRISPR-associated CARF protein, partial [Thermodesulfobacteriota bacterium]|nr:TIGR02710 family CRISPR-associated CARF protein [Thermodesulfobacteriota bacterium]
GYLAWDNFEHAKALKVFSAGIKRLELCVKFHVESSISDYFQQVAKSYFTLIEIKDKTEFFKTLHPILVRDMVSNAARRASQNKYDDAVARLYRALEMVGQIAFQEKTGCSTSRVRPDVIPEALRQEYTQKYYSANKNEKLQLPLYATFRVLKELNHPIGEKFFIHEPELKKILLARNNSILAHGIQAVNRDTYEDFTGIIEELFLDGPLIEFPELRW